MSLREKLEKLPESAWSGESVYFRALKTEADLIYAAYECELEEDQKDLVNPAWFSIGRAYLSPEDHYPCIICSENGQSIGFISLCRWLGGGSGYTWSYFIDRRYQGKGYGKKAAELAVRILKTASADTMIRLAAEKCNTKAHRLYRSLGFELLPERDGDDLVFGL